MIDARVTQDHAVHVRGDRRETVDLREWDVIVQSCCGWSAQIKKDAPSVALEEAARVLPRPLCRGVGASTRPR